MTFEHDEILINSRSEIGQRHYLQYTYLIGSASPGLLGMSTLAVTNVNRAKGTITFGGLTPAPPGKVKVNRAQRRAKTRSKAAK